MHHFERRNGALCTKLENDRRVYKKERQLPLELRAIYAGFGKDISKINGDETFELPIPATYVIGID